jgi:hypothetical protein
MRLLRLLPVPKVPLLAGPGVAVVNLPDDAVVLSPPPPRAELADVLAAVRDALRFPLEGPSIERIVSRGDRVTIVAELPSLPIPGAPSDPRQLAIESVSDELARLGVPSESQTLLVAGGLARRASARDFPLLVRPEFRRRFHGRLIVHDAEDPDLVDLGQAGNVRLAVNPALVDTDGVIVVSAAETVLHGGPAALVAAGGAEALRASGAWSLLQPAASQGWHIAGALERALSARVGMLGVSLVLNHPRLLATTLRGFPFESGAINAVARSPLRRAFSLLPTPARSLALRSLRRELTAAAAFAGPPTVAHAEALLRAIDTRETVLDGRLDTVVIGVPPTTPYHPRERPNPLLAAYLALGLSLRLWRDAFPVSEEGTAIILHPFHRKFTNPTQHPYRMFFQALRYGRDPDELRSAEEVTRRDPQAIAAYRDGRTCHPLLPFADWSACAPARSRLGAVLVAGCRDHAAARMLGLVPVHGVNAALEIARGRQGGDLRVGAIVSPPYFPIRVSA